MNDVDEKPTSAMKIETHHAESGYGVDEKGGLDRAGAIDAEKLEHDMTVWQSVKAYPAASWWAFVMSCTIVRCLSRTINDVSLNTALDHGILLRLPDGTIHRHKAIC